MMKNIIFISILGFSLNSLAQTVSWGDLEEGAKYAMANDVVLNDQITLKKGDTLSFESSDGMEEVLTLTFKNLSCTDGSLTSDIALVNPDPAEPDMHHQIGVEFENGCYVDVFMEPAAFYDQSFLAAVVP